MTTKKMPALDHMAELAKEQEVAGSDIKPNPIGMPQEGNEKLGHIFISKKK